MNSCRLWSSVRVCARAGRITSYARAMGVIELLVFSGLVLAACSSDEGGDGEKRAVVLDYTPQRIAVDALSDNPSPEYAAARRSVVGRMPKERVQSVRRFQLTGGRGAAIVSDPEINKARLEAASALGTTIDPLRVNDPAAAQAGLDALLAVLAGNPAYATAVSCDQLPGTKADDCAIGLVIIEVQRCAVPVTIMDAGVPGDSGAPDSSVADAGDAAVVGDSGPPSPVTPIVCGDRNVTGARMVTGAITASETWSGKLLLSSQTRVTNATITIMPGTEIYMDTDATLEIGWNNTEAAIIANGTAAAPIRFCGKSASGEAGYWKMLTIESNVTSDSVLRNVLIAEGGGQNAALTLDADITIDNVQVRKAELDGVWATDFKSDSRALTVEDSGGSALVFEGEGALTRFPVGGSFRGNAQNVARIRFTDMMASATLHNLGIPYLQENDLRQRGGELTLEAGVEYRVVAGKGLNIGWNGSSAGIHANGTAAAPVVFRGEGDNTNPWWGMSLEPNTLINSNLTYTEIRNAGGGGRAALSIDSPVHVDHLSLSGNAVGMEIGAAGLAADSTNLSITGTAGRPLSIEPNAVFTLPAGGSFTGNMSDQIELNGNGIEKSGTIKNPGIPYYIGGYMRVIGGSTITIAPGTKFIMGPDSSLEVGWNNGVSGITANGTADAHISFTGASMVAGFWTGVIVQSGVLSNSSFTYVDFGQAGKGGTGALELNAPLVPGNVTNCRFFQSAGYGITKPESNTNDYMTGNTFEDVALGAIGPS